MEQMSIECLHKYKTQKSQEIHLTLLLHFDFFIALLRLFFGEDVVAFITAKSSAREASVSLVNIVATKSSILSGFDGFADGNNLFHINTNNIMFRNNIYDKRNGYYCKRITDTNHRPRLKCYQYCSHRLPLA